MSIRWDRAEFIDTPNALAAEVDGVAVTMIDRGDKWTVAWSINVLGEGANLPVVEQLVDEVGKTIAAFLRDRWSGDWQPDDGA